MEARSVAGRDGRAPPHQLCHDEGCCSLGIRTATAPPVSKWRVGVLNGSNAISMIVSQFVFGFIRAFRCLSGAMNSSFYNEWCRTPPST